MGWLQFLGGRRRRSPFNNLDKNGRLTCGRINDQLYIGGELGPRDWDALQKEGVSVVINLQHEQQDVFAPAEKVDSYLWLPAPDGQAPSLEQLEQGVLLIRAAIRRGRKVFVHCKAGQGRAPLLCACYLITEGDSPLQAISRVREARARTLLTPEQSLRLREFDAAYSSRSTKPPARDTFNRDTLNTGDSPESTTTDGPEEAINEAGREEPQAPPNQAPPNSEAEAPEVHKKLAVGPAPEPVSSNGSRSARTSAPRRRRKAARGSSHH